MPFIPHSIDDLEEMMRVINISDTDDLFDEIPESIPKARLEGIPVGMTEQELLSHMTNCSNQQKNGVCFLGAGAYDHYIPASIWSIVSRGEFYSPYTPYQPEASQGTLQMLFEFQSMISELTGMPVSNSSLYDAPTALAEAILMSCRINTQKNKKVIVPRNIHPHCFETIKTITEPQGISFSILEYDSTTGRAIIDDDAPYAQTLIISQPNFLGCLEDVDELTDWAHQRNMIVIALTNPISLGLLKNPGQWGKRGADIVVGEAQPLGVPLSFGGPYIGFIASRDEFVRQLPGRIVGYTMDSEQNPCYVLTLQAREQHIRRGKATSNICTNQGLLVTAVVQYLSLLGEKGIHQVALSCHQRSIMLLNKILSIKDVVAPFSAPFFNEFVISLPISVEVVLKIMSKHGILAGYDLSKYYPEIKNPLLVCVTEKRTIDEIDDYATTLQRIIAGDIC
ncbi:MULTISPECIES: aminomethyl-transferring glycine dehydrogenase subunit GcvPA [Candidatus Ichthyocystis]|uniref:Probable glycine dehydrogenase (decarboxylating) subunit 1 n=1 Tax=Candidatus Ichthyocystis hellenicum TaxID=1561003 RepID=A0A0S4M3M7_9BURK|nr:MULTISPECIES: aminomethyl-transferring glycine dehydrogenase subunit GcvPA [Ichthyocystis]CUT16877.1 glycine dehydrogenase subunit 1 [Candidatus Ichthyocystis hellenicum]